MNAHVNPLTLSALVLAGHCAAAAEPGVVSAEFIYDKVPCPQCHASTLAETKDGLVAAWFGGTREGNPDVGIWLSLLEDGVWTAPVQVADGRQPGGQRDPCWNPVLFQPRKGPLLLFYKVGPSPSRWWGMLRTSDDGGKTWSDARRLPDGILGPIKNKPVQLADGTILCPSLSCAGGRTHPPESRGKRASGSLLSTTKGDRRSGVRG